MSVTVDEEIARISRAEYEGLRQGHETRQESAGPVSDLGLTVDEWGAAHWMFITYPDEHTDMIPVRVEG